ncbi:MAG TPA: response regulator [Gaiellaceae bacterium]|nr:response regulator [Gaiellaceae bacterium]
MHETGGKARRQSPDNGAADWLTLGQAARYLGVAQSTIRKWSDQGRLPAFYTPGGHRRYRQRDLDSFVAGSSAGAAAPSRSRPAPIVLIVDDDPRIREFVRVNLEMDGFSVREAGSADEGLAALEAEPPDLILLDVMMPRVDGWEMLQRVRERHGVDSIQVIMFSGQVDANATDQAEAGGAQAFVGKPFNPQDLVTRAKDLLGS